MAQGDGRRMTAGIAANFATQTLGLRRGAAQDAPGALTEPGTVLSR
jgi:hypothetical protein